MERRSGGGIGGCGGSYWWYFAVFTFLLSVGIEQQSGASNVLGIFPHIGFSHFKVFYPILRGLAESGHNVTVVTHIPNLEKDHPNYHDLLLKGGKTINLVTFDDITPTRSLPVLLDEFYALHVQGQEACRRFYESGHVEEILKRHAIDPYELVITEYFKTDCELGVPYLMQVPVVGLSSCALMPYYYDRILLPDTPSYVQSEYIGFPEELNWHERLYNFVQAKALKYLYRFITNYYDNKIIKKYLNIDVDVNEIAKSLTSLVLVNQHYTLSGSRPYNPQYIEVGGIHIDERQLNDSLPQDISDFLQKAGRQNVLFISWGSMVRASSLEKSKLQVIVKVLQQLPLKVIWKWEAEEKPTDSEQFLFTKWAPQLTLLCHPQIKYFWGHGGLLGTTEAAYCGKPLLVTPGYGDQFLNAYAVKNRRIGVILFHDDVDEEHLTNALHELMRPRYAENALALSQVFRHRQNTPLQTALWSIQHLLQHGKLATDVLQTKAVHLNWFFYHSLDSIAILLAIILAVMLSVFFALRCMCTERREARVDKIKNN